MLTNEAMQTQSKEAVKRMVKNNHLQSMSDADRVAATKAVFAELHAWSLENLAMGASADDTEKQLNRGLRLVKQKFRTDPTLAPKYGVFDPVTIFTVISALFSIVSWLVKWWNGSDE